MVTSCPASTSASTTWEPMNPLPPVTTTFIPMRASSVEHVAQRLHDPRHLILCHAGEDRQAHVAGTDRLGCGQRVRCIALEDRLSMKGVLVHLTGQRNPVLLAKTCLQCPP